MNKFKTLTEIATSGWKPFLAAFLAVFIMTVLQNTGAVKPPQVLTTSQLRTNPFDNVRPMLEQKTNDFRLVKTNNLIPVALSSEEHESLSAYAVVDTGSGEILLEKNAAGRLPIASLTKVMTALVTLDLAESSEQFTVSEKAADIQPTKMGLVPAQKWSRDELLNALILTSANDAAETLKEGIDQKYGQGTFIKAMNEKAKFLGLKNSKFDNPQGLDGNNFSSAEDLALLTGYVLKNYPVFKEIAAKDYQFYPAADTHKQADLYNWNGLLGIYPGVSGVKIGNTGKAGYTTIVVSQRENKQLLVVALGAPGVLQRDMWAARLLDLGFEKAAGFTPVNITKDQLQTKYDSWQYFE